MIKVKKRCVTLLEVLISIALTVLILTTLMFFYAEVGMVGTELDKTALENFQMRYVETRFSSILPNVVAENNKNKDFVFFSINDDPLSKPGSEGLIFTFFNGISLDKEISNHALGRIYLDKENHLMFAYWPSPKRWEKGNLPEIKREVLLENVDDLKFEFFIPPEKSQKKDSSQQEAEQLEQKAGQKATQNKTKEPAEEKLVPEPKGDWRKDLWLKEYEMLPALVHVIITVKGKQVTFAFPLASSKNHVIYGNGG